MSEEFFGPPPPPPKMHAEREREQEPWEGPPENMLGGYVPIEVLLAKSQWAVLFVASIRAYPSGFEFALHVRLRESGESPIDPEDLHGGYRSHRPDDWPAQLLRFGLEFADGAKATTGRPGLSGPSAPVLVPRGGGGGGGRWNERYWVWPLPPPGPLAFVCSWPVAGISFARQEIDGTAIVEAVERAEVLWPDAAVGAQPS